MYKVLLLAVFISYGVGGYAQEAPVCTIKKETDTYTKETKLSTGFMRFNGATLTIEGNKAETDFFFVVNDKCFNDASTMQVFFEGSKMRTTIRNAGSMNCDGYFHMIYKNTLQPTTILKKMAMQKVSQFIFMANDKKELIISLQPAQQQALMEAVTCMLVETDKLLPR